MVSHCRAIGFADNKTEYNYDTSCVEKKEYHSYACFADTKGTNLQGDSTDFAWRNIACIEKQKRSEPTPLNLL